MLTNISTDDLLICMIDRPEYLLEITINGRALSRVIIDQHYKSKHSESINDELILELVKTLDGEEFPPEATKSDFEFFTVDPVVWKDEPYRLSLNVVCC